MTVNSEYKILRKSFCHAYLYTYISFFFIAVNFHDFCSFFFFIKPKLFSSALLADTFLSYPILYYVWKRDFPTGMRLIMTKYNARQLQRFDRSYRMEERVVNRTGIENNETNDIEHKRIVKRDVHHKIGACCEYDAQCVAMMCFARN